MASLMSFLPTALMTLVWLGGLVVCATQTDTGRWRRLGIAGFGLLALSSILGAVPSVVLVTMGYGPSMNVLFAAFSILGVGIALAGAFLLIAAVVAGRGGERPFAGAVPPHLDGTSGNR